MLDLKALLAKILRRFAIEEFMLTAYAGFDSAYGYGRYDKATDSVRLYFYGVDSANLPRNTALFTVPDKYKPSQAYGVPIVYTATGGVGFYYASLLTNGTIVQNAGSTLRGIFGLVEYQLGGVIESINRFFTTLSSPKDWGWAMC